MCHVGVKDAKGGTRVRTGAGQRPRLACSVAGDKLTRARRSRMRARRDDGKVTPRELLHERSWSRSLASLRSSSPHAVTASVLSSSDFM